MIAVINNALIDLCLVDNCNGPGDNVLFAVFDTDYDERSEAPAVDINDCDECSIRNICMVSRHSLFSL